MKFRTRLSLLFGGLLVLCLVVILLIIRHVAQKDAIEQIEASLKTAAFTVDSLHQRRITELQQNVRLVAADYGFKTAYASEDVLTIQTALENHQYRLANADLMMLCDLDGVVLSNTYSAELNGVDFPWIEILDRAFQTETGETTAFAELEGTVYQLIIVPLLAPDLEAWVISGFRVDTATAEAFSAITGSEISFFSSAGMNTKLIASTLDMDAQPWLHEFLNQTSINQVQQSYRDQNESFIGYFLPFNDSEDHRITAFVQRSMTQALEPYRALSRLVLAVFLVCIAGFLYLIIRVSGNVTSSLTRLSDAAQSISDGHLNTTVSISGKDEIGKLATAFNQMVQGLLEKERVRDLLGKVVSTEVANKLINEGVELGGEEREVTVLFCDISGFTYLSESCPPTDVVNGLNTFFSGVSRIIESHQGVVDKYIGDAVMAVFGAPLADSNHAENAVRCAVELCEAAQPLLEPLNSGGKTCDFGVGVHTGTVVAGNVGSTTRLNYTVIGDTVNIASRVERETRNFDTKLLVTKATVEAISSITFVEMGTTILKGRTSPVNLFTVDLN